MECEAKLSKQDEKDFLKVLNLFAQLEAKVQVQAGGAFLDAGKVVAIAKGSNKA